MAKVKKTYSLDEEVVQKVTFYATALHLSDSAFLSMFISNLDHMTADVVLGKFSEKKEGDAGSAGED